MKKKKELARKSKLEYRTVSESLTFNVEKNANILYQDKIGLTARIEYELDWIISGGMAKGFMQMKQMMETIKHKLVIKIGPDHGFCEGSEVAYCLGLTPTDPFPTGEEGFSNEFYQVPELEFKLPLNVSIHFEAEKRNQAVTIAEEMFNTKAMMRMGQPIITLDNVIVEFHRDLKPYILPH